VSNEPTHLPLIQKHLNSSKAKFHLNLFKLFTCFWSQILPTTIQVRTAFYHCRPEK